MLISSSLLLNSESTGGFGVGMVPIVVVVVDDWDAESIVDDAVGAWDDDLVRKERFDFDDMVK